MATYFLNLEISTNSARHAFYNERRPILIDVMSRVRPSHCRVQLEKHTGGDQHGIIFTYEIEALNKKEALSILETVRTTISARLDQANKDFKPEEKPEHSSPMPEDFVVTIRGK
jgi:hypothetical protein